MYIETAKQRKGNKMYKANIKKTGDDLYLALIVRIDKDGEESVINGYSRHFKTEKAALKSTSSYISKNF